MNNNNCSINSIEFPILILIRHGESLWNSKNIFTGWANVPLSKKGIEEAVEAGNIIKDIDIDTCFTSDLIRAQMTASIALSYSSSEKTPILKEDLKGSFSNWNNIYDNDINKKIIPIYHSSALNERMYGSLQGLNKTETAKKFGEEKVQAWRRSYDSPPPSGESLKDTEERAFPYFKKRVEPLLKNGKNILISAHGNSIRAIIKNLENISPEEITKLEIPTGKPICYIYKNNRFDRIIL